MRDYYKVSDGSNIDVEDFLSYIFFLKQEFDDFVFDNWFCEDDFSDVKVYNDLKNLFQR